MKNGQIQIIIIEPKGTLAGFWFCELCQVRLAGTHYPK